MNNMEHFNLLDLDNDVLNIIGDYVKQDNRKEQRNRDKKVIFKALIMFKLF